MKRMILSMAFIVVIVSFGYSQMQIQWRAEASSGNWSEGENPCNEIGTVNSQWWYPDWGPNEARNSPNCSGAYSLGINNNHELNMNNNIYFVGIHGIVFNAGATSPRTISGEGIDLVFSTTQPKIINLSTSTHTINNVLSIKSNPVEMNPVNGNLFFSGTIYNNDNYIDIYGDNGKTITFSGGIEGVGGVAVKQNSTVILVNTNSYSGGTVVEAGTLELQGSIENSDVTVESGATLKINGDAVTVASLTVESGGNVEVVAGKSLTVSGDLSNSGTFTIKSDASSTGSLIVNGTTTGNITAERYIAGADWAAGDDGWHFLSSPVASQAIQPNFVSNTPATTEDFYSWDEVNNEWMNAKDGDGNWNSGFDANFVVAKGYLVAYDNDATKEFIGTPNTGNQVTPSLTASNGKYNLIGNPFSSAIAWNDGNWTLGNVGGTAQIWNSNAKDYVSLLANNIVPAMNGFMVYTTSSQTLTIPVASQTHSATAWHKNSNESEIILTAHDPNNNSYKQAIVGERSDASEGFDLAYDAYVLEGFAPKFYSINDNQQFTVNMFSELADGLTIPFGFAKNEGTEYYIKLEQTITDRTIVLTDLIANKTHNLSENPTYSFTASSTDSPDRFLLHFGVVGIGEQDQATTLNAYAYNNRLFVNNSLEQAQIAVYDLQGRLLMQQSANTSGLQSLPLDLPTGVYVVRLSNSQEAKSVKINVQ